jgi:hypothetical protein
MSAVEWPARSRRVGENDERGPRRPLAREAPAFASLLCVVGYAIVEPLELLATLTACHRVCTTCTQRDRRRVSVGSIAVAQTSYPFAVGCRKSYMRSLEIDRSAARNLSPMSRCVTTPPRPSNVAIR